MIVLVIETEFSGEIGGLLKSADKVLLGIPIVVAFGDKLKNAEVSGLKWILASVLSLWLAGISNIFLSLNFISLSLLLFWSCFGDLWIDFNLK